MVSSSLCMSEFKEFEPWLKFETLIKYGWLPLKLFSLFQCLTGVKFKLGFGGFETRLKLNSDSESYESLMFGLGC